MSTICAEHHNFFPSNQPIKDLLEIPPRKLLFSSSSSPNSSPRRLDSNFPYETNLHKFLPSNNNDASDDDESGSDCDPYGTDHFRMYEFKVRRCTRSRSHDWTDCPFAHPAEKARRRDPRRFRYSSTVCADFRRGGGCPHGDDCEFAHGVFECWLHPTRYRTEVCKDGKNCRRKVCFFAHSPRELRILPESPPTKYKNGAGSCVSPVNKNPCCLFCNCHSSSPTSTLLGLSQFSRSPSLSPPLSPIKTANSLSGYSHSPVSRLSKFSSEMATAVTYKDVLNELMNSIDSMNFNEISSPIGRGNSAAMNFNDISSPIGSDNSAAMNSSIPWLDCGEEQQQFVLSPVPSLSDYSGEAFFSKGFSGEHEKLNDNTAAAPDLGWVNDLLM